MTEKFVFWLDIVFNFLFYFLKITSLLLTILFKIKDTKQAEKD